MTYIRNLGGELRQFSRSKRSANKAMMTAMAVFLITAAAQAGPPKNVAEFAHKYIPVYNDTNAVRPLTVIARSFTALIENQSSATSWQHSSGSHWWRPSSNESRDRRQGRRSALTA